jgi:hypothetical protein
MRCFILLFFFIVAPYSIHAQSITEMDLPDSSAVDTPKSTPTQNDESIGLKTTVDLNSQNLQYFIEAHDNAKQGTGIFFTGLGLNLATIPLSIATVVNQDLGLAVATLGVGALATAFEIAGPIRAGVGASMAYDKISELHHESGIEISRPSHWGFYQGGWAFIAVGSVINTIANFIPPDADMGTVMTLSIISSGLSIAGSTMWAISTVKSLTYTKSLLPENKFSSITIRIYSPDKAGMGMMLSGEF